MIKILSAKKEDTKQLNALALTSKASWGYPDHYLKIWEEEIRIPLNLILNNRVFKAVNKTGKLLGFYGLEGTGLTLVLHGFWVYPEEMGKGIGRKLLEHMRETAIHLKAKFVERESDPNAYEFYAHMGSKKIGSKIYQLDKKKRELPILQVELKQEE